MIQAKQFNCLMDTGSQVTTVTKSFFDQHLFETQIEPLYDLLEVEGANGLPVPYLGYIQITITFPEQFLGKECDVPTLVLVVPDSGTSGFHVLIGTNILDVAYNMHKEKGPVIHHTSADGYKTVLKVLQLRHEQCHGSNIEVVRMHGKEKKVVPAGETVVLEGTVAVKGFQSEKCAIVEYPTYITSAWRTSSKDLPPQHIDQIPMQATSCDF